MPSLSVPPSLAVAAVAFAVLLAGWVLYPLVLALLARGRLDWRPDAVRVRRVSVVVATREAPDAVARRVADLRATDHPAEHLQIVVAVDRDAAHPLAAYEHALQQERGPATIVDGRAQPEAELVVVQARSAAGKAAALDCGVAAARHPLLVFADTAQTFDRGAIGALARYLDDPRFGAVTGRLCFHEDDDGGSVMGKFWAYELWLRTLEARVHSVVAVTGAIYAMRRALWRTPPPGLICDDLFVPLEVVRRGHRVGHCPEARAYDGRTFTREQETARKVRTLTGMLQMCAWQPWILVPWRNPIWAQFVCHKLVRLATPFLGAVMGAGVGWWLGTAGVLETLVSAAILAVGSALIALDLWRPQLVKALVGRGTMALRLFVSPVVATGNALRGNWNVWKGGSGVRRGGG